MRHLLHTSLAIMLIAIAMGCSRNAHDKRLVLADTLMWTAPDSALHILQAIKRHSSLQGDENQAYHALLLTQARFRVDYYDYPSDSLINTALNHYSDNHNRELYTRALLYKGAYYEVHDNPVEAIKWYKRAEDNADTTDYRNLAQINMRLGVIFYNNYVGKSFDLIRFKKSLLYYNKLNAAPSVMLCHSYLGNIYRYTNIDSARLHLNLALTIAQKICDSCEIGEIYNSLSKSYLEENDHKQALYYAKNSLYFTSDSTSLELCFYNLSRAYSGQGMTDSAQYYLSKTHDSNDRQLQDNRYLALRDFYNATNNHLAFKKYNKLYFELSDSLESNKTISEFAHAESNQRQLFVKQKKQEAIHLKKQSLIFIISIVFIAIAICVFLYYRYRAKAKELRMLFLSQNESEKNRINDVLSSIKEYSAELNTTREDLKETSKQYAALAQLLIAHVDVMRGLTRASVTQPDNIFKKTFNNTVESYNTNANLYKSITRFINEHYSNLITDIHTEHPNLDEEELKIIKLVALGFTYIDVAVLMGKKPNNMSTKFTRIARKLGASESLPKYIDKLKKRKKSSTICPI